MADFLRDIRNCNAGAIPHFLSNKKIKYAVTSMGVAVFFNNPLRTRIYYSMRFFLKYTRRIEILCAILLIRACLAVILAIAVTPAACGAVINAFAAIVAVISSFAILTPAAIIVGAVVVNAAVAVATVVAAPMGRKTTKMVTETAVMAV